MTSLRSRRLKCMKSCEKIPPGLRTNSLLCKGAESKARLPAELGFYRPKERQRENALFVPAERTVLLRLAGPPRGEQILAKPDTFCRGGFRRTWVSLGERGRRAALGSTGRKSFFPKEKENEAKVQHCSREHWCRFVSEIEVDAVRLIWIGRELLG